MSSSTTTKKLIAGVDTPAADDIITTCKGCGEPMVHRHPRHVISGVFHDFATGRNWEWEPTPEWVEAEAENIRLSDSRHVQCGPFTLSAEEKALREARRAKVDALRKVTGEKEA